MFIELNRITVHKKLQKKKIFNEQSILNMFIELKRINVCIDI